MPARTHGGSRTPEFYVWCSMRQRCYNPKHEAYGDYGGRGIKVCLRWLLSFSDFLSDVGKRSTPAHTLEREDNDGNYEPSNAGWATRIAQARNRRSSHYLTHEGLTLTIAEWSEITGTQRSTISIRLKNGWSVEQALSNVDRRRRT